nr:heat shock cognate 70 kDa protein-like [Tanacetum cinerariifolium]
KKRVEIIPNEQGNRITPSCVAFNDSEIAKFEELNATYFDKCIQLVEECLHDGEMKKKDVDEVVIVGGSSAAILAARLSGNDDDHDMKPNVVLLDVISRSLGIEIQIDGEKGHMRIIIPKNTCIPTSMKKIVHSPPNKTSVDISVYQVSAEEISTGQKNSITITKT